jgi:hypothetical protein
MDNTKKESIKENYYLISCIDYHGMKRPKIIMICEEEKVKRLVKKLNLKQSFKKYEYKQLKFTKINPYSSYHF